MYPNVIDLSRIFASPGGRWQQGTVIKTASPSPCPSLREGSLTSMTLICTRFKKNIRIALLPDLSVNIRQNIVHGTDNGDEVGNATAF